MDYSNIVKPGTEVRFKKQFASTYNGIVKAVWISDGAISYQVQFFNQGRIEEPYVLREMFEVVDSKPISTGFQIGK